MIGIPMTLKTHRARRIVDGRAIGAGGLHLVGSVALGALASGALAIGALAIARLVIGQVRIRRMVIDELVVRRLRVVEQFQNPPEMEGPRAGLRSHHRAAP